MRPSVVTGGHSGHSGGAARTKKAEQATDLTTNHHSHMARVNFDTSSSYEPDQRKLR